MKNINLVIITLSVLAFSCQKKSEFNYQEWQLGQNTEAKNAILGIKTEGLTNIVEYKNKKISISRQVINGKPVINSFVKKVVSNSDVELLQAQVVEDQHKKFNLKNNLSTKHINFIDEIKKQTLEFSKIEVLSTEEVYAIENDRTIPYTVVSFFDRSGTPHQAYFNTNGKFERAERVGSQFADVNTNVYLEGPKLSSLTDLVIKGISANPSLSNTIIYVTSESDKKINAISSVLKFDPKDDRFDQIQVFYYLNKALNWMKDNLQVRIPQRLDAVVHMGFPDKTNSAFYFQNKIRFGQGDDIVYSNIPQDASIVYHESFHALIDNLSRLPFEGEGGSLNEGFADFFTCLMTDRPYLGESSYLKGPYKRSLHNIVKLEEKNGGLYHDSLIVSGALWEIKEVLGTEKTKSIAIETLIKLNSASVLADFGKNINLVIPQLLTPDEQETVAQILKSRGF